MYTLTCTNASSHRSVGRAWGESLRGALRQPVPRLSALDAGLGPVPQDDLDAAGQWADPVLPEDRTTLPRGSR